MQFVTMNGRTYARFEMFSQLPGLQHAYSTRPLDVSARTDDRAALRDANRRQMAADLGLLADRVCYCVQVHRTDIAIIDTPTLGRRIEGVDAIITNQVGVPLMTFSADCPLVLVYDPIRAVLGMVHASWRCTCALATRILIDAMGRKFGCQPADLFAGIGPSAGPNAYEVKQDVYEEAGNLADRDRFFPRRGDRMYFDLWEANRAQLVSSGVLAKNIEIAGICTMTDPRFYSFRREGAGCGHFGLMAALASSPAM